MHRTERVADTAIASINVTPLIDVMLCLLIIFMIAMPTLTGSMPLDLPQDGPLTIDKPQDPIRIRILADGRLLLQGRPIAADVLSAELGYQIARDAERIVSIDADRDAQFQQVIDVLADARAQGATRIAMLDP